MTPEQKLRDLDRQHADLSEYIANLDARTAIIHQIIAYSKEEIDPEQISSGIATYFDLGVITSDQAIELGIELTRMKNYTTRTKNKT